jgi:hypothetical protein
LVKVLAVLLLSLVMPGVLLAQSGNRGGKLQSLRPLSGPPFQPSRAVELLDETEPDSKKRAYRIYLVGPNGDSIDLAEVESCSVEWRTSSKVGRLQDDLKDEKALAEKEGSSAPIYSFLATGEMPGDSDLTLEVTIDLPGKDGVGVASFSGIVE